MEFPPSFLNEIHDFLDFSQVDPNVEDDSYIINRSSFYNVAEKITLEFQKGEEMDSSNLIATHSPLHQTAIYCSVNSSCFSPWAAPKHGGFNTIPSKPEGQLLLKKCLLEMLPWMRDARRSKQYYVQAEDNPDSQMINTSTGTSTIQQQDDTAQQHMLAERTRRRKQNECLKALQVLLPSSPKKDKVTVLQSTIEQLKELKACKEDLEKHIKELQSTNAVLKSLYVSGSSSSSQMARGRGHMSINTNIHGCTSIDTTGGMVLPSPNITVTSLHNYHHTEHDVHHGNTTTSGGRASVSINSTIESGSTLNLSVRISARLTSGSSQLMKVLTCFKDIGLQVLSVQSRIEADMFMAQISARTNKDSRLCTEAQIQDVVVKALLTTDSSN